MTAPVAPRDLGLVLVHYRTPQLAAAAVERLRATAHGDGLSLDLVLVDNGSDAAGRELLRSLAERGEIELVEAERNLGYAAGANLGLSRLSSRLAAPRLGVMNPDVLVEAGCLGALVRQVDRSAGVAGPRFYWDAGHRLLLPPGERRGRVAELVATLGRRGQAWSRIARRRWRRHARRHWLATAPIEGEPSGALLLFAAGVLRRTGPFDEAYRLYFEESDWLARCRARGVRVEYVPGATAVHLYAQSSSAESAANEWFAQSVARFRERHYGTFWSRFYARIERRPAFFPPPSHWPATGPAIAPGEHWVEVTPEIPGFPAAAERVNGDPASWELPDEVARRHPQLPFFVRFVDRRGRELGCYRYREPAAEMRPLAALGVAGLRGGERGG